MDADALARASAEAMWRDDRASAGLGMRLDHVAPGQARLSLTVSESMVNGHGVCHGGLVVSLADSTMALACNSHGLLALIPVARNDDSSIISGHRYRARGWWGGRARNQDSYRRPNTGRTVRN